MSESPGTFGSGQPSDQPTGYTEPAAQHPDFLKGSPQPAWTEPAPAQPTPAQPTPAQPAPAQPGPVQHAPTQQVPMQPSPTQGWPQASPTQASPFQQDLIPPAPIAPMPAPGQELQLGGEQVLVSIGDISVTATHVYTPSGVRPLTEVQWSVTDMSLTNEGIPTWAIVCAVVFFLACFLGLLFLLVKETTTKGTVQVTVYGTGLVHTTQIPVFSPTQIADIHARVNYVRALVAAAPGLTQQPFTDGQAPGPGMGQQPGQAW